MIEHPTVFRRPRAEEKPADENPAEESWWLDDDPGTLRSPTYWLRARNVESGAPEVEWDWEAELASLHGDPDRMQGTLVDVRDYLPTRPRRISRRLRAPAQLVFAYRPFDFVPLELHILTGDPARPFIPCRLYDVNDQGICLAAPVPLATGTDVWICAHHREEPTALISLQVPVLNQRRCPVTDPILSHHGEDEGDEATWLHGLQTPPRDARLLTRCALDSLACAQSHQESDLQAAS